MFHVMSPFLMSQSETIVSLQLVQMALWWKMFGKTGFTYYLLANTNNICTKYCKACQYLNYSPGFKLWHRCSMPAIPTYEDYISSTPPSSKKLVFPDFKTFHNKISNYFTLCWMFCRYFFIHPIAEKDVNNYRIFNVEWQLVLTKKKFQQSLTCLLSWTGNCFVF